MCIIQQMYECLPVQTLCREVEERIRPSLPSRGLRIDLCTNVMKVDCGNYIMCQESKGVLRFIPSRKSH